MSVGIGRLVTWLRSGCPQGMPAHSYVPLMAVLHAQVSEDQIQALGAALTHGGVVPDRIDVGVGLMAALGELPSLDQTDRVMHRLHASGWPVDLRA